jgi:acetyltransferase
VGLLVPGIGLNASFAHTSATPGRLAMVAQSGALTTAMLDWAKSRGIGFSHFISLGESVDVDFGDVIDYLGSEPQTRAILLYIESITSARKFMSATRAASRNKPVIAVKAGRVPAAAQAAASHTGALAGVDDVYDAALCRAGVLRVHTTQELFDAAETLARAKPLAGNRLAILTNGGGPGVMAVDALVLSGGCMATLSSATMTRLNALLPATWSRANPVDIIGDAPPERYAGALEALLNDEGVDAVLLIHAPTAIVPSEAIARACKDIAVRGNRTVLSCWLGAQAVRAAESVFREAGIPTYGTPEEAVRAFLQLVGYRANQTLLMETPPASPGVISVDSDAVRKVIARALNEGRFLLTEPEARKVIAAYGIPVVPSGEAESIEECKAIAATLGYPVALKIVSPEISHKSDVGGVALNIRSETELVAAAEAMRRRCAELRPQARLTGYTVQKMVDRARAHEVIVGIASDTVFGPVLLFGEGGTAVEVIADRAIALPPLNRALARQLVSRARVTRRLCGYRDRPPVDFEALYSVLIQLSQLIIDIPQVAELDINPLLADEEGVIALDARIKVAAVTESTRGLSIRPYPVELEETIELNELRLTLRPIRPEDEAQHSHFLARIDAEDIQLRFLHAIGTLDHTQLARLTQIDYDREMAFIAVTDAHGSEPQTLGVVRAIVDPDHTKAEFAILVRSDWKGKGLGAALMEKLVRYCREQGMSEITGDVLRTNRRMLALAAELGFKVEPGLEPALVRVRLTLAAPALQRAQ